MKAQRKDVLAFLGSPGRLEIIEALTKGPKTHAELIQLVGSPQTTWRRLREMAKAGLLVRNEVSSQEVYYHVDVGSLQDVLDYLTALVAQAVVTV